MASRGYAVPKRAGLAGRQDISGGMAREVGQGLVLLALTGSSVGGFLGMVALATRMLGR
jgi:hypothetical protein